MGYCIYYKKSDDYLRFAKEEHVIPAGLGGIQKLKKGIVSDEANEKFSKLETVALRNSFIGLNRMNNGPGKRGSLNVKKVKSPIMRLLKQEKESVVDFLLGFIFAGQSYIIPQIILDYDLEKRAFVPYYISSTLYEESIEEFPLDLGKNLLKFFLDKNSSWKKVHFPFKTKKHFINIGYYQKKWFAGTSLKDIDKGIIAYDILPLVFELLKESKDKNNLSKPKILGEIRLRYEDKIDTDASRFYFMYLKTAFNSLALFKGTEFVSNEIFDEVRESIINLSNLNKFIVTDMGLFDSDKEIKKYKKRFPDKSHYVIIFPQDHNLVAFVSFYGEIPGKMILTDRYEGEDFIDGLICDWQNRLEFRLDKFL